MPEISLEQAARATELVEGLGYTYQQAGAIAGISEHSVGDILNHSYRWGEYCETPVFAELRRQQKKAFQVALFDLTRKSLIQAERMLPKASYYQAVTGAAILMDKERLYAGEPNDIQAIAISAAVSVDDLSSKLAARLVNK